jgi:Right handed beta helix region
MVASIRVLRSLILVGLLTGAPFARPAQAGEIHVPGDYPTIKEAIDAAPAGSVILVAPGTYTGPLNTNIDFGGKALELRSTGGPEVTIIDCQATGLRGLIFHSGETASAIVDGFTITRGIESRIQNNSSPTIRNCIFSLHIQSAMMCDNSSPVISQCKFLDNPESQSASAIYCRNNSFLTVDGSLFARNSAAAGGMGGGINVDSSSLMVSNSVFTDNGAEGGGGIASFNSSLNISHCDFERNSSDNNGGGGIHLTLSTATITDCSFYDNRFRRGAGLAIIYSTVTVTNSSFVANGSIGPQIAASLGPTGSLTLENTIIAWGSGSALGSDGTTPTCPATLRCCDVFGNQGGDWVGCIAGQEGIEGNFAADPQFCDLVTGDLTLNGSSPCLPGNHPQGEDCGLIGAFDQGCGPTAVDPSTWGAIKAAFSR